MYVPPSDFIRPKPVLQLPSCISNTSLYLESGFNEARVSLTSINYWLKLHYCPQGLSPLILQDFFWSPWLHVVHHKLMTLGFSPQSLLAMSLEQEILVFRGCLTLNTNETLAKHQMFWLQIIQDILKTRQCVLPLALLGRSYRKIPLHERVCPCDAGAIETTERILLLWQFYHEISVNTISSLLWNH